MDDPHPTLDEAALCLALECLGQLADLEFQGRVWIRGVGPEVSSFTEAACQLFDDTGLDDLLELGIAADVVGAEAAAELRRLSQLVGSVPPGADDRSLLHLPVWKEIVSAARRARALLLTRDPFPRRSPSRGQSTSVTDS